VDVLDVVQGPLDMISFLFEGACLGAASSSCPYAAVAIARSAFRKDANFTAVIGEFELCQLERKAVL